ncbi:MAG: hypothetical protein IPK64_00375 [bacterium]|nr:hypothetical protein [bacterium]
MKTKLTISILSIAALVAFGAPANAQTDEQPGNGYRVGGFLDEDGDGFNDLAPDADGDGIPNGLDPDFEPVGDGSGQRRGEGNGDGDGICDQDGGFLARPGAMGAGGGFGGEGSGAGAGLRPGTGTGSGDGAAGGGTGRGGRR